MGTGDLARLGVKSASSLTAPATGLTADRAIAVLPGIRGVLPQGALVRGTVIAVRPATGATSLVFALIAEATRLGHWAAIIGVPGLGWAAAAEAGVVLEQIAYVPDPRTQLLPVAATMLDGFSIVVLGSREPIAPGIASQLAARARTSGSVLIAVAEWPGASLDLSASDSEWLHRGRLRCRRLTVRTHGRGGASRPRETTVWLPDDPAFRAMHPELEKPAVPRLRSVG